MPAAIHLRYSKTEFPSTCSKKLGPRHRELQLCCCSSDIKAASTMPTRDLSSGVMSRTIRNPAQQRPAVLDGNSTAQSRSLDEGSSRLGPLQYPQGSAAEPRSHKRFWNQQLTMSPNSSVLSASQLLLHAVFTQSRAICLSFSVPESITHFAILHLLSQTIGQDLTSTETWSACLELAGHPTACMGMKIHPIHWRQAYLVPTPLLCTAPLWESLSTKNAPQAFPGQQRIHSWNSACS